jgi:hypothetical protein
MNAAIPDYVGLLFTLTTLLGVWLFKKAFKPSQLGVTILFIWLSLQGYLGYTGFYLENNAMPPKFMLAFFPTIIFMAFAFILPKGRAYMDSLDVEALHWIHVLRIPVEIVLYLLFAANTLPELLTYSGRNLDILAGLTVPLIIFYGLRKPILGNNRILLWNVIGVFLLLNIIAMVILSVETPFQQIHQSIATTGILYFPFIWLPSFLAPLVLFSHLISIRKLMPKKLN